VRVVDRVKDSLSKSEEVIKVCANPAFVEGLRCWNELLPKAGRIDATGNLVEADNSISHFTLKEVKKKV